MAWLEICGGFGRNRFVGLLSVLLLAPVLHGQAGSDSPSAKPQTVQVPQKPADIVRLAFTMNGVDVPSFKPWHIKLTYDEFDGDGDNVRSGALEEFYVGPRKYKRIYTGDALNQTEVATESGLYRSGNQHWPKSVEMQVRNEALRPLYRMRLDDANIRPDKIDWTVGKTKLPCVVFRRTDLTMSDDGLRKFCFDPNTVRVRYTSGRGVDETTYNHIVMFQDRFVAQDIVVTQNGKLFLKIHMEIMETISAIDNSMFVPPVDSPGPLGGRVAVPSELLMDDYLISRGSPGAAPTAHGEVVVKFVIGKDGRVIQVEPVSGPAELYKSAIGWMRSFRFRPFLILDQPVEAESTMHFLFG